MQNPDSPDNPEISQARRELAEFYAQQWHASFERLADAVNNSFIISEIVSAATHLVAVHEKLEAVKGTTP